MIIMSSENLMLQFVNLMNCIMRLLDGLDGGSAWKGSPLTPKGYCPKTTSKLLLVEASYYIEN